MPGTLQTSGFSNSSKDRSEVVIDFFEWGVISAVSCLSNSFGHLQKTSRICNADPLFREKHSLCFANHSKILCHCLKTILSFVKLIDLLEGQSIFVKEKPTV